MEDNAKAIFKNKLYVLNLNLTIKNVIAIREIINHQKFSLLLGAFH